MILTAVIIVVMIIITMMVQWTNRTVPSHLLSRSLCGSSCGGFRIFGRCYDVCDGYNCPSPNTILHPPNSFGKEDNLTTCVCGKNI
ncbi:hypothetical protein HD806DRAFT_496479 [Xylariaceae sp. AK1471]|nr:hypothetical protein HD806DRAFT_496479 [Xylariaceae sp. AK1471]